MNESENRGTAGEAIFGIVLLFILLIFLLYKFGNNKEIIAADKIIDESKLSKADFLQKLDDENSDTGLYNKYLKQIYLEQKQSSSTDKTDVIVENYKNELDTRVIIPKVVINLNNLSKTSSKLEKDTYILAYENLFQELKKQGGTSENKIFQAQISTEEKLLPLSGYDVESLLRISTEYDIFADKISNLQTPLIYEKKAIETVRSSKNISYIIKQMSTENDKEIYRLWISKYAENLFDIISERYVR